MPEESAEEMVQWTIRFEATGHSLSAARRAAREAGFDLQRAAEDYGSAQGVV